MGRLKEIEKVDSAVTDCTQEMWAKDNSQVHDSGNRLGNGKTDCDSWIAPVGE